MKTLRLMGIGGLVVASLIGCREGDTVGPTSPEIEEGFGSALVHLPSIPADFLAKSKTLAAEGMLVLTIDAPDMDLMRYTWPVSRIPAEPFVIDNIPVGARRVFTGRLTNSGGLLTHEGKASAHITPWETVEVHLRLSMVTEGVAAVCVEIEGLPAPPCAHHDCRRVMFKTRLPRPSGEWRVLAHTMADMLGGVPGTIEFLDGPANEMHQAAAFEICYDKPPECEVKLVPWKCGYESEEIGYHCGKGEWVVHNVPLFPCEQHGTFEAMLVKCCPAGPLDCELAVRDLFTLKEHYGAKGVEYGKVRDRVFTQCPAEVPLQPPSNLNCGDIARTLRGIDPSSEAYAALKVVYERECEPALESSCVTRRLRGSYEDGGDRDIDSWLRIAAEKCSPTGGKIVRFYGTWSSDVDKMTGRKRYSEFTYTCCVPEP